MSSDEESVGYEDDELQLLALLQDEELLSQLDSDWGLGVPPGFGTEEEVLRAGGGNSLPDSTSSAPPKKKQKKKKEYLVRCSECDRRYYTLDAYYRHQRVHRMEVLLTKHLPDMKYVMREARGYTREVLQEWANEVPVVGFGPQLKSVIEEFLGQQENPDPNFISFVDRCATEICNCMPHCEHSPRSERMDVPLPSEIGSKFLSGSHKLLDDAKFYNIVADLFEGRDDVEYIVQLFFCGEFIRRMLVRIEAYILRSLKAGLNINYCTAVVRSARKQLYLNQCIHYVAGSVVRRILRTAIPLSNKHEKWSTVLNVLRDHFLKDDLHSGPHADLENWTKAQDRGGLLYVSDKALSFFMYVAEIAEGCEGPDGSLSSDDVMKVMTEGERCEGLFRWDAACGQYLKGADSHFVMDMATRLFCSTWAKGIIKRRMSALFTKGRMSLALRQKMAGASKTKKNKKN